MNGKMACACGNDDILESTLINPFIHRLELTSTYDKVKTAIFTVAVLPFRVLAICGLLILAWCFACIGLYGLTEEDLRTKPMSGWRKETKSFICVIMRALFMAGGFHSVKVKGKQASPEEAPVLALAPHSTYFDSLVVVWLGAPSIVAKGETSRLPFFGKLINYTQPVYVWRDDPDSRHNTIKEIIDRVNSKLDWPQVLIFPEGTCTNRSCLITFKPGAFYPGVPIQPVCIRYPNELDTVTWTWEGPGALKLLWLTLTQIHSSCEIEFLPVYRPNEAEKKDPRLFAANVRQLMANALGVPVSNFTYDDCRVMSRAKELHLTYANSLVEVNKLRQQLSLKYQESNLRPVGKVNLNQFAELVGINTENTATQQLFKIFDKKCDGVIDYNEYELTVLVLKHIDDSSRLLSAIFKAIEDLDGGNITQSTLTKVLASTINYSEDVCSVIFEQVDPLGKGSVSYDDLLDFAKKSSEFSKFFPSRNKSD